jgi:hypothetical protein
VGPQPPLFFLSASAPEASTPLNGIGQEIEPVPSRESRATSSRTFANEVGDRGGSPRDWPLTAAAAERQQWEAGLRSALAEDCESRGQQGDHVSPPAASNQRRSVPVCAQTGAAVTASSTARGASASGSTVANDFSVFDDSSAADSGTLPCVATAAGGGWARE